jgi:5'-deoxynucleotidase YfbR-like HD superfamily hydrolase
MISPFKSVVGGGYKAVEHRLEAAIHLRFGLPAHAAPELKDRIKKADTISAYFEATVLAGFSQAEAKKFFGQPRGITQEMLPINPLPAIEAQRLFCERFDAIETARAACEGAGGR